MNFPRIQNVEINIDYSNSRYIKIKSRRDLGKNSWLTVSVSLTRIRSVYIEEAILSTTPHSPLLSQNAEHKYCSCCCSVIKSCPTLCNPMDCSMSGFPVLHYLPEFAQILVHWIGHTIQPPHFFNSTLRLITSQCC